MGRIVVASLAVFVLPVFAAAQSRGTSPAHAPATPGPHPGAVVLRTVPSRAQAAQTSPRFTPRVGTPVSGGTGRLGRRHNRTPFNSGQVDFQDVPGLGFDYPHLAAISANRSHRSRFNSGFPFGFNGFLLSPPVIVEEAPGAEPPTVAQEEIPVESGPIDSIERPSRLSARVAPHDSGAPSAPQPDAEQYVFVRRDGTLVFAVAYSWQDGALRYVTPEGFRRTIASDALDLAATQKFNEQRGLVFRFPA